jgi:hypothetical protein
MKANDFILRFGKMAASFAFAISLVAPSKARSDTFYDIFRIYQRTHGQ